MALVYIIKRTNQDFTAARAHGDLWFIFKEDEHVSYNMCRDIFRQELADFNKEEDKLVLIGDPIIIGIAFAVLVEITGGKFDVLKWDRLSSQYFLIGVNLERNKHVGT